MINNLAVQQLNQQSYKNVVPNGTTSELVQQIQQDDKSLASKQKANAPLAPIYNSGFSKTSKILIIVGASVAFLIIFSLLLGILIATFQKNNYDEPNSIIKTPPQYANFEKIINEGQKDNLIKLRNVPRSEITYICEQIHNQTTTHRNENNITSTVIHIHNITHRISLLTTDVKEDYFDMVLYFQNTYIYQNGIKIGQFKGLNEILAEEERISKIRQLKDQKLNIIFQNKDQDIQQQQEQQNYFQDNYYINQMANEYGPLTQLEKQILKKLGITQYEFITSNYPIIKFRLTKDGQITKVFLPIGIRYDIFQNYLTIFELIIPRLSGDIYNIYTDLNQGRSRILQERRRILQIRNLAGDVVVPLLKANLKQDGKEAELESEYSTEKSFKSDAKMKTEVHKTQKVEPAGLVQSQISSKVQIQSNNGQEKTSLIDKIQIKSEIIVKYDSQKHDVGQEFLDKLEDCQFKMKRFDLTWEDALDMYQKVNNNSQELIKQSEQQQNQQDKRQDQQQNQIQGQQQDKQQQENYEKDKKRILEETQIIEQSGPITDVYKFGPVNFQTFITNICVEENQNSKKCKLTISLKIGETINDIYAKDIPFDINNVTKTIDMESTLIKKEDINKLAKYTYVIPTPVGINIKIDLGLQISGDIQVNFKHKNGILNLIGLVNTKLVAKGTIAGDLYIISVGGSAQGEIINGSLDINLNLNVLDKLKGGIVIKLTMNKIKLTLGLFQESIFKNEVLQCFKGKKLEDFTKLRQLGLFSDVGNALNTAGDLIKKGQNLNINGSKSLIQAAEGFLNDKQKQFLEIQEKKLGNGFTDVGKCIYNNMNESVQKKYILDPITVEFGSIKQKEILNQQW